MALEDLARNPRVQLAGGCGAIFILILILTSGGKNPEPPPPVSPGTEPAPHNPEPAPPVPPGKDPVCPALCTCGKELAPKRERVKTGAEPDTLKCTGCQKEHFRLEHNYPNGWCAFCEDGFELVDGACVEPICPSDCSECKNPPKCDACKLPNFDPASDCSRCAKGFSLIDGFCEGPECPEFCNCATDSFVCLSCKHEDFDVAKQCTECVEGKKQDIKDTRNCIDACPVLCTCDGSKSALPLDPHYSASACTGCKIDGFDHEKQCEKCLDGFQQDGDACVEDFAADTCTVDAKYRGAPGVDWSACAEGNKVGYRCKVAGVWKEDCLSCEIKCTDSSIALPETMEFVCFGTNFRPLNHRVGGGQRKTLKALAVCSPPPSDECTFSSEWLNLPNVNKEDCHLDKLTAAPIDKPQCVVTCAVAQVGSQVQKELAVRFTCGGEKADPWRPTELYMGKKAGWIAADGIATRQSIRIGDTPTDKAKFLLNQCKATQVLI